MDLPAATPVEVQAQTARLRREIEKLILAKVNINAFGLGTPLAIQAASMGDLEAIRTLHAAGADLKRRDSLTGQTPLQAAQAAGHAEMIQFLHEHGGDPATYAVRSLIRQMRSANSPRKPAAGRGPASSGDADGSSVASAGDDNEGDDAAAPKAGGTGLAGVAAAVAETAGASRGGGSRRSLTRQTSFLSPPSAIYLNRTVISTPAGDLSLEDVFNEVKQEGQRKISVTRELPMALTIMGLYWSPQLHRAALADSGCDVYHLEHALEQLADDVYGEGADDGEDFTGGDAMSVSSPTRESFAGHAGEALYSDAAGAAQTIRSPSSSPRHAAAAMSERSTDPERSPATESPRARSRPLSWLGGPEDGDGHLMGGMPAAASSPRPPVVPARKAAAALGAGGVASLPRSPRPVPYFSGALARAGAAAAAAAAALAADEASPVVPSSLLGGGGTAGACDAAPLVLSDREDTSGTEASEGYAQVHGGDSVASPRLSGASSTLLVSLQSPPDRRLAAHAGGGGSTTILGVELAPGFKTPTAAVDTSVDVTDLGDLSALKGAPPSGGDSGGGGSVAPLSARSTSSGGSPRVPPGPPPRDRKPVRPPVTPEMSQMSPDHGAVRAAAAALRQQSSSSLSASHGADPAVAASAPLSFRAEPPVPPPVSFASAAPTAISTPLAQGSVAGAQVFSPSPASPIVWTPSSSAAAAFAPSGDASSPAALARQQLQQAALPPPPPPPPPSEADRDRRIDFTTFCTTIAMLQAAGAYKYTIEKALAARTKMRRQRARLSQLTSATFFTEAGDGGMTPLAPLSPGVAQVSSGRLNFFRQRSASISGGQTASMLQMALRPPLLPVPPRGGAATGTARSPQGHGGPMPQPSNSGRSQRNSASTEGALPLPPPRYPLPAFQSSRSRAGSEGGGGGGGGGVIEEEDDEQSSGRGSSTQGGTGRSKLSSPRLSEGNSLAFAAGSTRQSQTTSWNAESRWPSSEPPGPVQRASSAAADESRTTRQTVSAREAPLPKPPVPGRDAHFPAGSRPGRRSSMQAGGMTTSLLQIPPGGGGGSPLSATALPRMMRGGTVGRSAALRSAGGLGVSVRTRSPPGLAQVEPQSPSSAAQLHAQMLLLQQQLPGAQPSSMRPSAAGVHAVALAHSRAMAAATAVAASGGAAAEDAHQLLREGASPLADALPSADASLQRSARQRRQSTSSSGVTSLSSGPQGGGRKRVDLRVHADLHDSTPLAVASDDASGAPSRSAMPEDSAGFSGLVSPTGSSGTNSHPPPTSSAQVGAVFRTQSLRRMTATPCGLPSMASVVNAAMRQHRTSTISADSSRSPVNSFVRAAVAESLPVGSVRAARGSARSFAFTAAGSPLAVSPAQASERMFFPSVSDASTTAAATGATPSGSAKRRVSNFSMSSSRAAAEEAHAATSEQDGGGGAGAGRWPAAAALLTLPFPSVLGVSPRVRPTLKSVAVAAMLGVRGGPRPPDASSITSPKAGSPSLTPLTASPHRQRVSFSLTPIDTVTEESGESAQAASSAVGAISSGDEADVECAAIPAGPPTVATSEHPSTTVRRQSLLTKQGSESQLTDKSAASPDDERPAEVFLGGACNPTTWRHTTAIPFLEDRGVTFYNPQVENWYPELVEQEAKAKDDAEVVFFVVGPETRAIASMIEVAELITSGRQVVLVLQDVSSDVVMNGHSLPPDEVKDLNRGRAYLANVADRHDVTVYQSIEVALQEAYALIQQRRVERATQFVPDDRDDMGEGPSDSDAAGSEASQQKPAPAAVLLQQQVPLQPPLHTTLQPRPSITSALADLASQFGQDGYEVDDAISEDDDEDRGDGEEDEDALVCAGSGSAPTAGSARAGAVGTDRCGAQLTKAAS